MIRYLTKDKIDQLKDRIRPSKEGFLVLVSNDRVIQLTHEDISLIADFDKYRYSSWYNNWIDKELRR